MYWINCTGPWRYTFARGVIIMCQLATDVYLLLQVIQLHLRNMLAENARRHKWTVSCDFPVYHVIITCSCGVQENVASHSLLQFFYIVCLLWQLQTVNDKPQAPRGLLKTKLQTLSPLPLSPVLLCTDRQKHHTHTHTHTQTYIYMHTHTPATVWPVRGIQTNILCPLKTTVWIYVLLRNGR